MARIQDTSCTVRDLRRFDDGHGNVSIVQDSEQPVTHDEKHSADAQSDSSSSNRRNSTSNCSVRGIPLEARDLRFSASLQLGHVLQKKGPIQLLKLHDGDPFGEITMCSDSTANLGLGTLLQFMTVGMFTSDFLAKRFWFLRKVRSKLSQVKDESSLVWPYHHLAARRGDAYLSPIQGTIKWHPPKCLETGTMARILAALAGGSEGVVKSSR